MLAVTATDVAFVAAFAAVAAAIASPLSAWLIARETHRQERWEKTYDDLRDAYQRCLRTLHSRRVTANAFADALDAGEVDVFNARAAATESVEAAIERLVAVGAYGSDSVRQALREWQGAYNSLSAAVNNSTFATDEERHASAEAIRQALRATRTPTRKVEDAIRTDLRKQG